MLQGAAGWTSHQRRLYCPYVEMMDWTSQDSKMKHDLNDSNRVLRVSDWRPVLAKSRLQAGTALGRTMGAGKQIPADLS